MELLVFRKAFIPTPANIHSYYYGETKTSPFSIAKLNWLVGDALVESWVRMARRGGLYRFGREGGKKDAQVGYTAKK